MKKKKEERKEISQRHKELRPLVLLLVGLFYSLVPSSSLDLLSLVLLGLLLKPLEKESGVEVGKEEKMLKEMMLKEKVVEDHWHFHQILCLDLFLLKDQEKDQHFQEDHHGKKEKERKWGKRKKHSD